MDNLYVQYGCGLSAPLSWKNFDASPTLRIQRIPILGQVLQSKLNVQFPSNVLYGDIVIGLPIEDNSCNGVYCSHTLEHLALNDFYTALNNTYKILKPNGIFRCVLPDLELIAKSYLAAIDKKDSQASIKFMGANSLLGVTSRSKGLKGLLTNSIGNAHHLWMWDQYSLTHVLAQAGFKNIRACMFNDSANPMFIEVEDKERFAGALAFECIK